jgi:AcrR family transcriptional regulator
VTRDEILEAAAVIISQKGFHATSMQDIADAVNLQKASLYHHITSKQKILIDLLERALHLLINNMEQVMAQSLPPQKKLCQAMRVYLQTMLENRELAGVLLLEHRSLEPEELSSHIPRRDEFEVLWRQLIEQGIEQKVFYCSDPALVAKALLGVMNWTITWYRPDGRLSPQAIAEHYADLFLDGLLIRPGKSRIDINIG